MRRCRPGDNWRRSSGGDLRRQAAAENRRGVAAAARHVQSQPDGGAGHDYANRHCRCLRQYLLAGRARPTMPRRARNVSHQRASGPGRNRHRDLGCRCRQASWHQPRQRTWPDRRAPRRQRVSRPVDRGQRRQRLDDQLVRRQHICRAHRATMRSQRPGGRAAPAPPGVLGPVRPSHEKRANAQREKEPQEVREDEGGQIGGQHGEAPRCEGASRPMMNGHAGRSGRAWTRKFWRPSTGSAWDDGGVRPGTLS